LFRKVTGLTIPDFELLISLNVFNAALMNDAVYKFKRYEDSSLSYTGIQAQELKGIGLYDTVIYPKNKPQVTPATQNKPIQNIKKQPVITSKHQSAGTTNNPNHAEQVTAVKPTFPTHKVGDNVFHKTFGAGTILSIDEKYVICRFEGNREKKFFYPQVFEQGYLS
jgi:hypothetical protein